MDPQTSVALLLVLCLMLVLIVYVLGVEVGKAGSQKEASGKPQKTRGGPER